MLLRMFWDNDATLWLAGGVCCLKKRNVKNEGGYGSGKKKKQKRGASDD
jgi:hypothetical protein